MIEITAKVVIWLCMVCLLFALVCTVLSFVFSMPFGFVLAPVLCFVALYFGIKYLQKTE